MAAVSHQPAQMRLIDGLNQDLMADGGRGNGRQTALRPPRAYIDALERAATGAQRLLKGMNAIKDFGRRARHAVPAWLACQA